MANSARRSINYTPRMTQWEALEAMPVALRDRCNGGRFDWDAYAILRFYRRELKVWTETKAIALTVAWLDKADDDAAMKQWRDIFGHRVPSPTAFSKAHA